MEEDRVLDFLVDLAIGLLVVAIITGVAAFTWSISKYVEFRIISGIFIILGVGSWYIGSSIRRFDI